jgi:hypothetical protein
MNTNEALNVLVQVASAFKGTLKEHEIVQNAIETLKKSLLDKNAEHSNPV